MNFEYAEELKCHGAHPGVQLVHYSAPVDRIEVWCPACNQYSFGKRNKVHHRLFGLLNGLSSMSGFLLATAGWAAAFFLWIRGL